MNKLIKMIHERKIKMVEETQTLEYNKQVLTNQLNQVNTALVEMNTELRVLQRWEEKLAPKEKE